jgi:hypothetical protein
MRSFCRGCQHVALVALSPAGDWEMQGRLHGPIQAVNLHSRLNAQNSVIQPDGLATHCTLFSMEAIAGLSLAANILQVVDLTAKLLSKGREIQQAGSTIQNFEIETITTEFAGLSGKLRSWARPDPAKLGPLAHESQVQTSWTPNVRLLKLRLIGLHRH